MMFIHTYHMNTINPFMVIWFMLWYRAPNKGKRLFVLASLYARLSGMDDTVDSKDLSRVNSEFKLTANQRALKFPALASRWVWKRIFPLDKVMFHSLENEEHYINRLVKKTPCWLWYADCDERRDDIRRLVHWMRQSS